MKRMMILMGLLLTLLTQPLMAQPPAAGGDLEAIRVGYITKKLSLTTDEAKVFWPVYDAYRDEMKLVRDDQRDNVQSAKENFDTMTDQESTRCSTTAARSWTSPSSTTSSSRK